MCVVFLLVSKGISTLLACGPLKTSGGNAWVSEDQPKKLLIAWLKPHDRLGEPSGGLPWPRLEVGGDG